MQTRLHLLLSILCPHLPSKTRFDLWAHLQKRGQEFWFWEGKAQRVEGDMYIKLNFAMRPEEGDAMAFVRAHTSIPIPFVVDNVTVDGQTALVLQRVAGSSVQSRRLDSTKPKITPEDKTKIIVQLSIFLSQLRAIPPPDDRAVCGFGGTPIHCERVGIFSPSRGPWPSIQDFHAYLIQAARLSPPADVAVKVWDTIEQAHNQSHRICFTHGDLGAHNLLINDDFDITAIIDWETASWMPEYWEYTKSTFQPIHRPEKSMWFQTMSAVFPQYSLERRAELFICQHRERYT